MWRPDREHLYECTAIEARLGGAVVPLLGRFLPVRAIIRQAHDDRRVLWMQQQVSLSS